MKFVLQPLKTAYSESFITKNCSHNAFNAHNFNKLFALFEARGAYKKSKTLAEMFLQKFQQKI